MIVDLKKCSDVYEFSDLLGIPAPTLTYLLYKLPDPIKYKKKCLSKKNGSTRQIFAPERRLKDLQRKLADVLYECLADLDASYGKRRSFGFERGVGIFENADCHTGKRWVYNVDLKDFFPSINFGRVISFFKKNKDFSLDAKIATYIAQIAIFDNHLPQGAPTSPVISNLICGSLDYRLSRLARHAKCNYSRYADDISFSTNLRKFPALLAVNSADAQGVRASPELERLIAKAGFEMNHAKTRLSHRDSRQMVTGLIVNKKPNIRRDYYKKTRATVDKMVRGKPYHIDRFCDDYKHHCEDTDVSDSDIDVVEGRISHCFEVNRRTDPRKETEQFFNPSAIARTYSDLLFLKMFSLGSKPIVLTEGPSDLLYLKAALKSAKTSIKDIVEVSGSGDVEILVDFYKFSRRPSQILGLTGGTSTFGTFLERYAEFVRRRGKGVPTRPFIMFTDNDDGLNHFQKVVDKKFKVDISLDQDDPFYRIANNAFIVKTPHQSQSSQKTSVEDFLDQNAVKVTLNGKTFTSQNKFDESKHFGKVALSHHLYDNRDKYDFTNFQPILQRFSAAINS